MRASQASGAADPRRGVRQHEPLDAAGRVDAEPHARSCRRARVRRNAHAVECQVVEQREHVAAELADRVGSRRDARLAVPARVVADDAEGRARAPPPAAPTCRGRCRGNWTARARASRACPRSVVQRAVPATGAKGISRLLAARGARERAVDERIGGAEIVRGSRRSGRARRRPAPRGPVGSPASTSRSGRPSACACFDACRDQRVRGVAPERGGERHLHGFGEDQPARQVEVRAHPRRVDLEPLRRRTPSRRARRRPAARSPAASPTPRASCRGRARAPAQRREHRRDEAGDAHRRRERDGRADRIALVRHRRRAAAARAPPARTPRPLRSASAAKCRARACPACRPAGRAWPPLRTGGRAACARARWRPAARARRRARAPRPSRGRRATPACPRRRRTAAPAHAADAAPMRSRCRAMRVEHAGELEAERHRQRLLQPGAARQQRCGDAASPARAARRSAGRASASISASASRSCSTRPVSMDVLAGRAPVHVALGVRHPSPRPRASARRPAGSRDCRRRAPGSRSASRSKPSASHCAAIAGAAAAGDRRRCAPPHARAPPRSRACAAGPRGRRRPRASHRW